MTHGALTPEILLANADHTLLTPSTTAAELDAFIEGAEKLGAKRVCVSPSMLPVNKRGREVVTVVGFPSGVHKAEVKAFEAAQAVRDGADEVDVVVNPAFVHAGDWDAVEAEIRLVREATTDRVLKVIIESASLTDEQIVGCCKASEAAGADYVKTSTGFNPAGGASVHAVKIMADTVGGRLGVKASGGIRTAEAARELWAAGATRLGISGTKAILDGWDATATDEAASGY